MSAKIMVVDDEESVLEYVKTGLELNEYEVIAVDNSLKAVETAEKEKPDLIVLDFVMPNLDGYGVWQKLNAAESTKNIPVIFVTGSMTPEMLGKIKQTTAHSYMLKPFDIFVLAERIRKALSK